MPTYAFIELNTREVIEKFMSISAREQWLKDNPNWEHYPVIPQKVADSVRIGHHKIDNGFKEVLQKIKAAHPLGTINTQ